ncbi:hypothetical protein N7495_005264 [Penicillium taxi]|uniref:uncharacterized protein n=1 Tax=Penicillium taxi TaxID=168475 RepID=UPI00254519E8|nr:uncharacterized protein N7495_005264 [Penicillium taxi]KAJ5893573.1 hypothetical protein N7495_005264 [Penicillium taxi]
MAVMVQAPGQERAVQLAREAVELVDAGHREAASRNLREALSIAPEHPEVKVAFLKIQQEDENGHQLLDLCRRYTNKDESAGKKAAAYLRTDGLKPPEKVALEVLRLLLAKPADDLSEVQDDIISELVRHNSSVRQYFSNELQNSVTTFFDDMYDRGDGAAICLDTVVLDPSVWPSDKTREHCESELFQLFLAKLMESGHDLDGRSLKGIARLLAVDAALLKHLVDDESFEVIVKSLDNRLPLELRSQATLAITKYLEVAKEAGEKQFAALIASSLASGRLDNIIIAFSAVAAIFPVVPTAAANVFLSDDFMKSLIPLVSRDARRKKVEVAILELFNAACINRPCREVITKNFSEWLSHTLTNGSDEGSELAAVVLAKVRASETKTSADNDRVEEEDGVFQLVERFKGLMSETKTENIAHAIEGLAYSSVKPSVKEQLTEDLSFLRDLISALKKRTVDSSVLYGGLMIIINLTQFLPNLSEEQKKMSQLKNYADASAGKARAPPDPREEDESVLARCDALIDAGVMALLTECGRLATPAVHDLIAKILVALTRRQKSRGVLAQQGAIKLLLVLSVPKRENNQATETTYNASHALARILISVDPSHVFSHSGFPQVTSAVRPLLSLLTPSETTPSFSADQSRDLLPVFESLLALTNLASVGDDPANLIVREGWSAVEELLLSSNTRVQRAACELICNLVACESGYAKFVDGSKRASQRVHILLAFTDAEDAPTRSAAGGALAMLTEFHPAVASILEHPRAANLLLRLCQEDNEALAWRGAVCVRNLTSLPSMASGNIDIRAREAVRAAGGVDVLVACLKKTSNTEVHKACVEALNSLLKSQTRDA